MREFVNIYLENWIPYTLILLAFARIKWVQHMERVHAKQRRKARFEQGHIENEKHRKAIAMKQYCRETFGKDSPMQVLKDKVEGYRAWVIFLMDTLEDIKKEEATKKGKPLTKQLHYTTKQISCQ